MNDVLALQHIEAYSVFLLKEERSQATIEKYIRDIKKFYRFAGEDVTLTKETVMAFKNYLSTTYKTSSVNSMLASVNGFLTWMGLTDLKVKSVKMQKQLFCNREKELNRKEYERLIEMARRNHKYRLEMIMQTIGGTGIRISELSFITIEAVISGEAVVRAKGKQRVIFFTSKLRRYLLKYCKQQRIKKGPVFVSRHGKAVDRSNVWREMKQLCQAAGVNEHKVFPHNLRHLFARTCYQKKKDIVYLADLLGHSNIETTRIYTVSSGNEHKKILNSLGLVI